MSEAVYSLMRATRFESLCHLIRLRCNVLSEKVLNCNSCINTRSKAAFLPYITWEFPRLCSHGLFFDTHAMVVIFTLHRSLFSIREIYAGNFLRLSRLQDYKICEYLLFYPFLVSTRKNVGEIGVSNRVQFSIIQFQTKTEVL